MSSYYPPIPGQPKKYSLVSNALPDPSTGYGNFSNRKFVQDYDDLGNVRGGHYEDDLGNHVASYDPGKNMGYTVAAATNPAPETKKTDSLPGNEGPYAATLAKLAEQSQQAMDLYRKEIDANKERYNTAYNTISGMKNIYDPSTQQYKQGLSNTLDQTNRRYEALQARTGSQFGGATGIRAALANGMNAQRVAGLSNAEAAYNTNAMNQANSFEMSKNGLLAQLVHGDYSGAMSGYQGLTSMPFQLENMRIGTNLEAQKTPYILSAMGYDLEGKRINNQIAQNQDERAEKLSGAQIEAIKAQISNAQQELELAKQKYAETKDQAWWDKAGAIAGNIAHLTAKLNGGKIIGGAVGTIVGGPAGGAIGATAGGYFDSTFR